MATFREEKEAARAGIGSAILGLVPDSATRIKNHARNDRRGETRDGWSRQSPA
jgi:hypothetical protein